MRSIATSDLDEEIGGRNHLGHGRNHLGPGDRNLEDEIGRKKSLRTWEEIT